MHHVLPLVLALTFASTHMQAQAPGIGDSFAGFPVLVEGKNVPFERFVGDVPVAIFLWDAPLKANSCSELEKAATKLAGERVRLLSVEPIANRCPEIPKIYRPAASAIEQPSAGSARMMIVHTTAVIRLIQPVDADEVGISRAAASAVEWEPEHRVLAREYKLSLPGENVLVQEIATTRRALQLNAGTSE